LPAVFSFFSKPENLRLLTPGNMGFEILTPSPIGMKEGALVDYVVRIAGLPVRWTSMITCYEPPSRFVDLQLKGPYAYWHHAHTFTGTDDGTVIVDEVHYSLPFGVLGRCIHALFVKRQLEFIFARRAYLIERIFSETEAAGTQHGTRPKEVLTP